MIYLILILGLVIRLISLNQSFWLDEATSATVVRDLSVGQLFTNFLPGDFHPPLYYLILKFWSTAFGISEVALRFLSVLAGIGTIYTTYLIGKELKDKKLGIIAGLLLATSGLHIYYSQETRMYALATLFVSLTLLYFMKILKKGRVGEWAMFSFLLALVAMTDYVAILIFPVFWIFGLLSKQRKLWWKKFLASHIILIGTGLLWRPYFFDQLSAGLTAISRSPLWSQVLGQTNFKQLILIPTKFIFGRIDMEPSLWQFTIVGAAFLVFGFLLFRSIRTIRTMSNTLRDSNLRVIWLWLTVPLILGAVLSFRIPTLSYFRFLFVLPAFYLLVAIGLQSIPKSLSRASLLALVVFNLFTSSLYLFSSKNHREDWRGLTQFVKQESVGKFSAVVFPANSQQEAYRYYDKDAKIVTSETVDKSFDELWLMRYVQDIFDPKDLTRSKVEDLGYKKTDEYDFKGVIIWKYFR